MTKYHCKSLIPNRKDFIIEDPKDLINKEFTCPICESHRFYSSVIKKILRYVCSDCGFRWFPNNNHKYFKTIKD